MTYTFIIKKYSTTTWNFREKVTKYIFLILEEKMCINKLKTFLLEKLIKNRREFSNLIKSRLSALQFFFCIKNTNLDLRNYLKKNIMWGCSSEGGFSAITRPCLPNILDVWRISDYPQGLCVLVKYRVAFLNQLFSS